MANEQQYVKVELGNQTIEVTPARHEILSQLMEKGWFGRTALSLQLELATLPQEGIVNHDGFLQDLVTRPEQIAGVQVLWLEKLARGNFGVIPVFKVFNHQQGKEYTYEYFSWRYGTASGAKGIVFVTDSANKVTHFIVLKGEKFATGKLSWDSVGGFADLNVSGVATMLDRIKKEIREELGLPDLIIERVYNFGEIVVDAGMTNNRPDGFAALIQGSQAEKISSMPLNPDDYELRSGALIFPIQQLKDIVLENTDGYFRNAVLLSVVHGIIPAASLA